MTQLSRSLSGFFTFLVIALSAQSASAQAAPADFCRDHWFAMGECRDRRWTGPKLMLGVDLGVSEMTETGPFGFNKGVGSATDAGPAWGLRVGVELFSWLAVEARYVGMYNGAQASVSPAGSVAFLTTGADAVVRLTAPLPYVHPYIFAGAGYYDVGLTGSLRRPRARCSTRAPSVQSRWASASTSRSRTT